MRLILAFILMFSLPLRAESGAGDNWLRNQDSIGTTAKRDPSKVKALIDDLLGPEIPAPEGDIQETSFSSQLPASPVPVK